MPMMSRDVKESKMGGTSLTWRPQPILAKSLTEETPLEEVYVGRIRERRNTSKAIQMITVAAPGFGHLKRCNGFRLILSPVEFSPEELNEDSEKSRKFKTQNELKDLLVAKGFDLSLLEEQFEILKVPSKPARTKIQADRCANIWPINFHPDPTTESIISGDIFNPEQLLQIEKLMRVAIEAVRIESVQENSDCNGSALIVDPTTGEPIAIASSKIDEHPLWHPSMLAIDLVAKIHGGGAWNLIDEIQNVDEGIKANKRKFSEGIPLCYPPSLSGIKLPKPEPLECVKKRKEKTRNDDNLEINDLTDKTNSGPYLCTNFWLFLIKEPCAICAMALLHSRVSKIFYGIDTKSGVLRSRTSLHTIPGLNHRYQVWSGVLENECREVCNEIKSRNK